MRFIDKNRYTKLLFLAAAVVLAIAAFLSIRGCNNEDSISYSYVDKEVFRAVPVDVSAIFLFSDLASINSALIASNPLSDNLLSSNREFKTFLNRLYSFFKSGSNYNNANFKSVLSFHYSANNEISPLFIIHCPIINDLKHINHLKESINVTKTHRKFNNIDIYKIPGGELLFWNDYVIVSSSAILIESSVRHLLSNSSILDNSIFDSILVESNESRVRVFINHSQIGKIFSGIGDRSSLRYADFFLKFCSWSSYYLECNSDNIKFIGRPHNILGSLYYSQIFEDNKPQKSSIYDLLPYNTFSVTSFTVADINKIISKSIRYREFSGKGTNPDLNSTKWLGSLSLSSISQALIPYGSQLVPFTILSLEKSKFGFLKDIFSNDSDLSIQKFEHSDIFRLYFGDLFKRDRTNSFFVQDKDYILISDSLLLNEYIKGSFNRFTLSDYLSQTKMSRYSQTSDSYLSSFVNGSFIADSITRYFRRDVRNELDSYIKSKNILLTSFQIFQSKEGPYLRFHLYADSLSRLPVAKIADTIKPIGWENDTVIVVPKGPFELINFNNGDKEFLEQLPNNWLRLSDKNRKGLWGIPFKEQLKGYVEQVDYFNNGKLQMMFASSDEIYLLDRTGRYVYGFPKTLRDSIILGPKIFEIEDSQNVMLLHKGNFLRLYSLNMTHKEDWRDISLDETIKDFPEIIIVNGKNYFVLRTMLRTSIFNIEGKEVGDLKGKYRLRPDTEIILHENGVIFAKTIANFGVLLDLETGKYKKVKIK